MPCLIAVVEDEGLEGRAGLAVALRGEVVLVVLVVRARHHRLDLAAVRVDRDQRRRRVGRVGEVT